MDKETIIDFVLGGVGGDGGGMLIFQINLIILIFVKINTHNFILAL